MMVTTGGRALSVSEASTSTDVSMSMSLSLTRLMLWPNSVTSNSAVSWSMVCVIVTGMPILNSALTRSAPRSAMRLASSWTVIDSGTLTSRTCFCAGPDSMWWRFSFSRERLSAARLRARFSSSSDKARETVSLPRWRCSSRPRPGRAGSVRLGAGAWVGRRKLRSSSAAALPGSAGVAAASAGVSTAGSTGASAALRLSSARRRSSALISFCSRSSRRRASSSEFMRASSASRSRRS